MHFTAAGILVLFCVLLAAGSLLWIVLVSLMAWSILTPPRMTAGKAIHVLRRLSPGDLGLGFEDQNFTVRDAGTGGTLRIAGWWIPASPISNRCAILIHGYADAKVGSIAFAPLLNDLDFHILAIDLRAHGESDGRFCTGGYCERDDINQVIDQLRAQSPLQTERMILFGISLGAAVACGVAEKRGDIAAVILESPFPDYRHAIFNHTRLMNLPTGWMLKAAVMLAQKAGQANFDEVRVVDLLKKIKCPALLIVGQNDALLSDEDVAVLRGAVSHREDSELWLVPDAGHVQAMATSLEEYQRKISEFLLSVPRYE